MSDALRREIDRLVGDWKSGRSTSLSADSIITAIEDAVLTASRKYYKTDEKLRTRFNEETGQVDLFAIKHIVSEVTNDATEISLKEAQELYGDEAEVDMEIEFPKRTDVLGRIAAQTAKQVIFQKVREAERDNVFVEFNDRVGEVINSKVKRFENGDVIVEIGRLEAVLPRMEQSRAESWLPGERLRAVVKGVNRSLKGPQVVLSRTDPALLVKLFEQEVPEIYDGTVMIRGAVREAGDRAKVAVYSREHDVDPVGACLGMRGVRVQAIVRELRGEKIDIFEWSEDPVQLVTNALRPAKVHRVSILDERERIMEVVVEDQQLSLAIGKKGQNVRLAAKLTGWRLDIKVQEEHGAEFQSQSAQTEKIAIGAAHEPSVAPAPSAATALSPPIAVSPRANAYAVSDENAFLDFLAERLGSRAWLVATRVTSPIRIRVTFPIFVSEEDLIRYLAEATPVRIDVTGLISDSIAVCFLAIHQSGSVVGLRAFLESSGDRLYLVLPEPVGLLDSVGDNGSEALDFELGLLGIASVH